MRISDWSSDVCSSDLPGRFEVVDRAPLVVLDMAHNPDGTEAVADTLSAEFDPEGGLTLVVGMLGGRDPDDTLAPLLALRPRRVVCTQADSPRSVPAGDIAAAVARGLGDHVAEVRTIRSEEHTSELQSLMRISYAVFCLKKKTI